LQASLGYFIAPLASIFCGRLFLREALRPLQIGAILLAIVGVAWLSAWSGQMPWIALGLGVSWSIYGLLRKLAPLPALPGVVFVFLGIFLAAWIDDFTTVSGLTVGICLAFTLLAIGLDYVAGMLGAKKVGASREAIVGSFIGTIAGVFSGLWGLLFMPLVGAAIGQYMYDRDVIRARNVGIATWLGMVIGMLIKIAITFLMIGIFVFALMTP